METKRGNFAQVVIPYPLKEPLTYSIPAYLGDIELGMGVSVPLGRRSMSGVVVDFVSQTALKEVKAISGILDPRPVLDNSLLDLARWVSQYYLAPLGVVLSAILPPSLKRQNSRLVLPQPGEFGEIGGLEAKILAEARKKKGRLTTNVLAKSFHSGNLYRALDQLMAIGAVEIHDRKRSGRTTKNLRKTPAELPPNIPENLAAPPSPFTLSESQKSALHTLQDRIEKSGFETFLLYGVTGSGKTEVYLRAIEEARRQKKRSLILIPEISLTPQLLDRLRQRFADRVGILHSALTPSDRWSQWWHIREGNTDVVVGARSAVFAPVPDLGLIIVDEEHDPSYKQEDGLRYHARDLSVVRGKLLGCPVILGSATPSMESFENAAEGRYRLLELPERVERKPMPIVEIVDLRQEAKSPPQQTEGKTKKTGPELQARSLFSSSLKEALQENHKRGQQSLVFLNRRGYANFLQCRLCGFVLRCPNCSVTTTYHLRQRRVYCHHCGFGRPAAELCPKCGNPTLTGIGFGTEQVEQELHLFLHGARVARMDRDTTGKRGSQERMIRLWEKGEIDVLVGTQMITKGHDVGGVTLVGAILADLSLNVPDFRAAERTFQLLCQVAGRAGRGTAPGRVIVQTYAPDHYALQNLTAHDYKNFFAAEIEFRRALNYPPFRGLVLLRLDGSEVKEVETQAKTLGDELRRRQTNGEELLQGIEILGPAPAPIERLRNRYRWQLLLKGRKGKSLLELAQSAREMLPPSRAVRLHVDVDPYNML